LIFNGSGEGNRPLIYGLKWQEIEAFSALCFGYPKWQRAGACPSGLFPNHSGLHGVSPTVRIFLRRGLRGHWL
jgi:hypothetical protein